MSSLRSVVCEFARGWIDDDDVAVGVVAVDDIVDPFVVSDGPVVVVVVVAAVPATVEVVFFFFCPSTASLVEEDDDAITGLSLEV